jgi:predicted phosphodiesterase
MKYAIISDIHGNLEALDVVLSKCKEVGVERYICLGDIVGYNANPKECLKKVRELNLVSCVKGNHDEYVSNGDEEMEGFNPHAKQAVLWTKAQLDEEELNWLSRLPMRATVKGTNMTVVHATLDSPEAWGYIFDVHHASDSFSYQFTQLCFCGHSHVPIAFCKKPITMRSDTPIEEIPGWAYKRNEGNTPMNENEADNLSIDVQVGFKYLINVGSVGQPRNRDPRASFVVYDAEAKMLYRYRIPYDIAKTQQKVKDVGLPERLASRLSKGY